MCYIIIHNIIIMCGIIIHHYVCYYTIIYCYVWYYVIICCYMWYYNYCILLFMELYYYYHIIITFQLENSAPDGLTGVLCQRLRKN